MVSYQRYGYKDYNLAFGDWDEELQKMDTTKRSNNGDRDKVLATVAATVLEFFEHHPGATICAEGNVPVNTRLYQMKINMNSGQIEERFCIQGYINNAYEDIEAGKNYEYFILWEK